MAAKAGEPWFEDASAALAAEQAGEFETDEELGRAGPARVPVLLRALRRRGARVPRVAAGRHSERRHAPLLQPGDLRDLRPAARARARSRRRRSWSPASRTSSPARSAPTTSRRARATCARSSSRAPGTSSSSRRPRRSARLCSSFSARERRRRRRSAAGRPVVLPTDTVYGLCGDPEREAVAREVYAAEGPGGEPADRAARRRESTAARARARARPRGRSTRFCRGRTRWSCRTRSGATRGSPAAAPRSASACRISQRSAADVLHAVGAVFATSANVHGGPDPREVDEIPEEIRTACGAVVDAGELPGDPFDRARSDRQRAEGDPRRRRAGGSRRSPPLAGSRRE